MTGHEEELKSLRQEMLFRIGLQNGLLILLLPLFVGTAAVQVNAPAAAYVMALAFCSVTGAAALMWCHHGIRQAQLKAYLLLTDRNAGRKDGWENWLPRNHIGGFLGTRWFVSTKGVFLGIQLTSIMLAWLIQPAVDWLSFGAALCVIAATALFLLSNPKERLGN